MEDQAIDFILGGFLCILAWFFGGLDGFLSVLITFSIIDWIVGTLDCYNHEEFNKKIFWEVLSRKIAEFCFVGIAHVIDKYMLGDTATFRTAVTLFYIIIEGKSIIKHADKLNIPVPDFLKSRVYELEKRLNKGEGLSMRGEGIKKAIEDEIFRGDDDKEGQEAQQHKNDVKEDIEDIYKRMFDND